MYLSAICVLSFGKYLLSLVAHLLIGLFVPLARTFECSIYSVLLVRWMAGKDFLLLCGLPLHSVVVSIDYRSILKWGTPFVNPCYPLLAMEVLFWKPLPMPVCWRFLLHFPLEVSNFGSTISRWILYRVRGRWGSKFSHLLVAVPFSQHHLLKMLPFS